MQLPRWLRLRYSLRTLFIVVTLLSVPLAWIGWQWWIVQERTRLLNRFTGTNSGSLSPPADAPLAADEYLYIKTDYTDSRWACVHGVDWVPSYIRKKVGDRPIMVIFLTKEFAQEKEYYARVFSEANVITDADFTEHPPRHPTKYPGGAKMVMDEQK
jgi:hypothetical protein